MVIRSLYKFLFYTLNLALLEHYSAKFLVFFFICFFYNGSQNDGNIFSIIIVRDVHVIFEREFKF
jgi:hypothetical protein